MGENKLSRVETICLSPIAADLRPCADGSAVRIALVACSSTAGLDAGTDRRTDGSRYRLMRLYSGGVIA